jgi:putative redox protein
MEMKIEFPGGKKVNSTYKGYTVQTDQPKDEGGDGAAPEPFDLFLSAIGTCAGVYVVLFCEKRGIDVSGIRMSLDFARDEKTHLVQRVRIRLALPPEFPAKYESALARVVGMCTVKRNILDPPDFVVETEIEGK